MGDGVSDALFFSGFDDDHFEAKLPRRGKDGGFVPLERGGGECGKCSAIEVVAAKRGVHRRQNTSSVDAFAAAYARDDHGLIQLHCVTGRAGRQACMVPTGAAREMAMRVSVPPNSA